MATKKQRHGTSSKGSKGSKGKASSNGKEMKVVQVTPLQPEPERTYNVRCCYSDTSLSVINSTGNKTLNIDLTKVDEINMVDAEQTVLYGLMDEGKIRVPYEATITANEARILAGIRDRITALNNTAPVAPPVQTVTPPIPSSNGNHNTRNAPAKPPVAPPPSDPVKEGKDGRIRPTITRRGKRNGMEAMADSARRIHDRMAAYVTGYGLDANEYRVNQLQAVIAKMSENTEYYQVEYDIPQEIEHICHNPSDLLWFYGFRMTWSCWILPAAAIESPVITALFDLWRRYSDKKLGRRKGVRLHVIKYHPDEISNIKDIAQEQLAEELQSLHTSLITRLDNAAKKLEEVQQKEEVTENELSDAQTKRNKNVQLAIKQTSEALQGVIQSAMLFDEYGDVKDLIDGVRKAIDAERQAFNTERIQANDKPSSLVPEVIWADEE